MYTGERSNFGRKSVGGGASSEKRGRGVNN